MKAVATSAGQLHEAGRRLDASYHASDGVKALRFIRQWAGLPVQLTTPAAKVLRKGAEEYVPRQVMSLERVCVPGGIFVPGRFKRFYVHKAEHGDPWLSPSDMLKADLSGLRLVSRKFTPNIEALRIHQDWILLSRSGTIGNLAYVREDMDGLVGSDDIIRIVADPSKIPPGYLYAFLSSPLGKALIEQKTYGTVVPHIEAHHVTGLPVPRLAPTTEQRIHELVERAAALRVEGSRKLKQVQARFEQDVLGISIWEWQYSSEHGYAVGVAELASHRYRLDAFHYVGYVEEAAKALRSWSSLADLAEPYQPPIFRRPYTGESGIPFLSGMDLYNSYPRPHMYIARTMKNLDRYITRAGTILVQNVGQRYGLFARPTILPKHLDQVAVTQHLTRVYVKDSRDRGFVYVWLSTEFGRRLLLKQSFGTSMGVLFEHSFRQMPVPVCTSELRYSFEPEVQAICEQQDTANLLEDKAQVLLVEAFEINEHSEVLACDVGLPFKIRPR